MEDARAKIKEICKKSKGRSQLFPSGSQGHLNSIRHFYESSSLDAGFSVEPGSADDLAEIMEVIKDNDQVYFAVKGGGHASNPGFSSTSGIQISLSRFNNIDFDEGTKQLTVGAGCVFDEIYKYIRPKKYNIVGGGGSVGIGGWMTGGGYSLKTSQYGLGIDNLVQVEVVLPHGEKVTASKNENTDLFWAIRGGGNNFGIATEFIIQARQQGKKGNVYGGLLTYDKSRVERVKAAMIKFMEKNDPKASIVAAFRFYRNHGIHEFKFTVLAFYDEEKPDVDPFQDFLAIPQHGSLAESTYAKLDNTLSVIYDHISADHAVSLFEDISVRSFPKEIAGLGVMNARARWGNVMVFKYTLNLINVIEEEGKAAKLLMEKYQGKMVVADIWPFLPTMSDKSTDSAWPHKKPNGFLIVYFMWDGVENDSVWIKQMTTALGHIREIALQENCTTPDAPVYCNTALDVTTTPQQIYRDHLVKLSQLRRKFDPHQVMDRTGGFRIPFMLEGNIVNANISNAIGLKAHPGPPIHSGPIEVIDEVGENIFQISPSGNKPTEYTISIKRDSIIYFAVEVEDEIWYEQRQEGPSWEIFPEPGPDDRLAYSIGYESKRWVLRGNQVKIDTVENNPPGTLWRFNIA